MWYNNIFRTARKTEGNRKDFYRKETCTLNIHEGHREKMLQRFLATGLDGFADHEVLELLLFFAIPRRDTNPIAHALIQRYGSLSAVFSAPIEDLEQTAGIGKRSAILLRLTAEVYRKVKLSELQRETILNSTERAGAYLLTQFVDAKHEKVYQLCLDRKGKLLACKQIGDGGIDSANLDIRKIVENTILTAASGVILAHNHPSGIALPSDDDFAATIRARQALATINVPLLDHIIVADNDFVSLADSGYFA